jgi:hypothetical protein
MFTTKKDLWDRYVDLHNEMASLQSCYKTQLEKNNELETRVSELEGLCAGLINNYKEVTEEFKNIFGVEDIDPTQENKAKQERVSISEAITDLFDWSDEEGNK